MLASSGISSLVEVAIEETSCSILLSDTFKYFKKSQQVKVELYADHLEFHNIVDKKNNTKSIKYHVKDIVGSKVAKGRLKNDTNAYLTIYMFLPTTSSSTSSQPKQRKRLVFELECSKHPTLDENLHYINKWHVKIEQLIRQDTVNKLSAHYSTAIATNLDAIKRQLEKPYLIFVNPKSGAGKAKNIYHEHVVPVMAESSVSNTVVFTQHANYAKEYVKSMRLEDWRGILVVSGDGLVYEVLNGLWERKDWRDAIRMPVGAIPGGSANAIACSCSYLTQEPFANISLERFAKHVTFNMIKSIPVPLDLVIYELNSSGSDGHKQRVVSGLSLEWAIIADVDLESEKYRYLGAFRFVVGALKRILNLRIYRGRLSFLPADTSSQWKAKTKVNVVKYNEPATSNSSDPKTSVESSFRFKHLKPASEPVPLDWVTIEDNFVLFLIMQLPLIAPDFLAAKEARFNDGNMHMVFIKEGIGKQELLSLFTQTETGQHLDHPLVEYVKIRAFRLEPLPLLGSISRSADDLSRGVMMIDGERVPCDIIQGELSPAMGNVLANVK